MQKQAIEISPMKQKQESLVSILSVIGCQLYQIKDKAKVTKIIATTPETR